MASDGQLSHRLGDAYARERERSVRDQIATRQRVDQSTTSQGNLRPEAIASALSIPIYMDIAGTLSIGNDIGPRRRIPQAVTIWQVRVDARTGPTAPNSCTLHIAADGARIADVSIAAGLTIGVSSVSVDVDPGALLTVDCSAANSAANVAVMIATRTRGR